MLYYFLCAISNAFETDLQEFIDRKIATAEVRDDTVRQHHNRHNNATEYEKCTEEVRCLPSRTFRPLFVKKFTRHL